MKEIKFRVYSRREKKYCYWGFNEYGFRGFPTNDIDLTIEYCRKHSQEYIGLEDKNKKEIYKGDIIKFNTFGSIGVVEWNKRTAEFLVRKNGGWVGFGGYQDMEIIGNMDENPELLGGINGRNKV